MLMKEIEQKTVKGFEFLLYMPMMEISKNCGFSAKIQQIFHHFAFAWLYLEAYN
jgi:glutaredoxin-related protein